MPASPSLLFSVALAATGAVGLTTAVLGLTLVVRKAALRVRERLVGETEARYRRAVTDLVLREMPPAAGLDDARAWLRHSAAEIQVLQRDLHAGTPWVRHGKREALRRILREMGQTLTGETRDRVRGLFEKLHFVREAVDRLGDRRWWKRAEACRDLGAMRSRAALYPLVGLLTDPEEEVRQEAAVALILIAGIREALGPILERITCISRWFAVRLSVAFREAGVDSVAPLVAGLGVASPSVREFAAAMMGALKDPAAVPALRANLSGSGGETRAAVLLALGATGEAGVLGDVVPFLGDSDPAVRRAAAEALGLLGAPAAVSPLAASAEQGDLGVRRAALRSLALLGPDGAAAVRRLAMTPDPLTRGLAVETLDEMHPRETILRPASAG